MARTKKESEALKTIFGNCDDTHLSKKIIQKLAQYNMKYEEITKVILTHSERAFLEARLITMEECYTEIKKNKKTEVAIFLSSLPELQNAKSSKKLAIK